MKTKLVRFMVVLFLLVSVFNVPFQTIHAEDSNYALVYFEQPSEIAKHVNQGIIIQELYSEKFLCNITPKQEEYLTENKVFHQILGDITKIQVRGNIISSTPEKNLVYPLNLKKELTSYDPNNSSVHIVQFIGPMKQEWKKALSEYGINLYLQMDQYAYLTKSRGIDLKVLHQLSFIRSTGYFPPSLKSSEDLEYLDYDELVDIDLTVTLDFDSDKFLKDMGITKDSSQYFNSGENCFLRLFDVDPKALPVYSKNDYIIQIVKYYEMEPNNADAAQVAGVRGTLDENLLTGDIPSGLKGEGEIIGVADTGLSTGNPLTVNPAFMAPTFQDKVIGAYPPGLWGDYHSHGTHVSGTVLGTGVGHTSGTLRFRGMAPEAKLVIQNFLGNQSMYQPISTIFEESYAAGSRVHNNSWGSSDYYGTYDSRAVDVDDFLWNHKDMAIIKSAGNDRDNWFNYSHDPFHRSLGGISACKNLVVIGASQNRKTDPLHPCDPTRMTVFSSIGPAHDNRIKPDVIGPGLWLSSTRVTTGYTDENSNYYFWGGTSMSAPVVTGSMGLFREYYRKVEGLLPNEIYASLLKATLINGCDTEGFRDFPGYTSYHPSGDDRLTIPNPITGWGRVNAKQSLYPETGTWTYYQNNSGLSPKEENNYYVEVIDENTPLKMTLVWTDYPGIAKSWNSSERDLVNDLDLILFSYEGETRYRGNQLNSFHNNAYFLKEEFSSIEIPIGKDTINNVEVINIPTPRAGVYKITVRANGDNPLDQSFSLVASGEIMRTVRPSPEKPGPPINLRTKTNCENVVLKWDPAKRTQYPIRLYEIIRMDIGTGIPLVLGTVADSILTFTDDNVTYNKKYNYYVVAIDSMGTRSIISNIATGGEALPPSRSSLWCTPSINNVVMHWSPSLKGTCPIESYEVYRAVETNPFLQVTTTNSRVRTWADLNVNQGETYSYYVQAVDIKGVRSMVSNVATAIIPIGKEDVKVSAMTNKDSYSEGDSVIIKIELVNVGRIDCSDEKIIVNLPSSLSYSKADKLVGLAGKDNSVTFNVGLLEKRKKYTLTVFCAVDGKVLIEKASRVLISAKNGDNFQDQRLLRILLKPKKSQNKNLDSSIRLGNAQHDPATGRAYISMDTVLELNMKLTGGSEPYTMTISWGDGSNSDTRNDIEAGEDLKLTHKFEAKGSMNIKITVTDSLGRRKTTSMMIDVR
ncbi:MAG: S8 family serine peptidase [Caldisericia bacterium]|nr:S8 family serine peptidase [Caldisericia bacterium]